MTKFVEFHFASQDGAPPEPFTVRACDVMLVTVGDDGAALLALAKPDGATPVLLSETYEVATATLFRVTQ